MQKAKVQEDKNKSRWRDSPERCSSCDFASSTSPWTSKHRHEHWYGAIPVLASNTDFSPVPNIFP